MNKKVLKVMICLVGIFLTALYVVKIFFPEQFVMVIENENLIKMGMFIDQRKWLYSILCIITSFLTYWLYLGAVTKKWFLNWKEIIAVVISIVITHLLYEYDIVLANGVTVATMFILPAISNAGIRPTATVFTVHSLSQLLSIQIRNLPALLTSVNFITMFLMTMEGYFWLLLFYLFFNLKEEK